MANDFLERTKNSFKLYGPGMSILLGASLSFTGLMGLDKRAIVTSLFRPEIVNEVYQIEDETRKKINLDYHDHEEVARQLNH